MRDDRKRSLTRSRRKPWAAFRPCLEHVEKRVLLSTFVVTNTGDNGGVNPTPFAGTGTLRQAIVDSNATDAAATGGTSQIDFAIPAAAGPLFDVPEASGNGFFDPGTQTWTIKLASPLPAITSPVTIDGYSQAEVGVPFRYPTEAGLAIQTLSVFGSPTGGTFELNGLPSKPFTPTPPIPWNATAAQVTAAIESVIGPGTVTVTGGPFPNQQMTLIFGGPFARQIVGPLGSTNNLLTGGNNPGFLATSISLGGMVTDPTLITSTPNTVTAVDGNNAHVRVIIDGSQTGGATGFVLDASHSTLRGLVIEGFGVGVSVPQLDIHGNPNVGDLIQGNYIGKYVVYPVSTNSGNALAAPNVERVGIGNTQGIVVNANNATIGGTNPQEDNVISGNTEQGVLIEPGATGNVVEGNQIGIISTSVTGTGTSGGNLYFQVGNGAEGVLVFGSSNQVGGSTHNAGNLISANGSHGVRISGSTASGTLVAANIIGLGPGGGYLFGTGNPGNGDYGDGVRIEDSAQNRIGGPTAAWGNTISSNFGAGVYITGAASADNQVLNNKIGVTTDGAAAKGNSLDGVTVLSPSNTIGPGNIISANLRGVDISGPAATGDVVQDNLIGTDVTGELDLGNAREGVLINGATGATIEGNSTGSQVISGNLVGVAITLGSSLNLVVGNLIGSDKTGLSPLPNAQEGVLVDSSAGNTIGGTTSAARNLISANHWGVRITGASATSNVIQGNYIGTDITGAAPLGNEVEGVIISAGASGNLIGGSTTAAGNIIAFNQGAGVNVQSGFFNSILTNSIFSNGLEGIVLQPGANHNQPAPVLGSIQSAASGTVISGTVTGSAPSSLYTIQFFANASNLEEGKTFLGQVTVTTDGSGFAQFTGVLAGALNPNEPFITATATSAAGDTSEFSKTGTVTPFTVEFAMAGYTVNQTAGTVTLTVIRSGGDAATVSYATSDGSAAAGVDYVAASGVLSFQAGQTQTTFAVSIVDTGFVGGLRDFLVRLIDPTGGLVLGNPSTATVTILGTTIGSAGPTVLSLQPIGTARGITSIVLRFSEPLDPNRAENLLNYGYSLQAAGKDQKFGTTDDLLFGIASATYNANNDTVTLRMASPIRCSSFIKLTINQQTDNPTVAVGVADTSGNLLDGNYDGRPGGVFTATFARGQHLNYLDGSGNSVGLRVSGGGTMQLVRRANGSAWQLTLLNTAARRTTLSGQVHPATSGATGVTTIGSIVGLSGVRNLLTNPPFIVGSQANTAVIESPSTRRAASVRIGPVVPRARTFIAKPFSKAAKRLR